MSDLILIYKGKLVVLLMEEEITNNTFDGLMNTGLLRDRFSEAVRDLGVHKDLYVPSPLNPALDGAATIESREDDRRM